MAPTRFLTLAAALLLSACGSSQSASTSDAGHQGKPDTGSPDTGLKRDTGRPDTGTTKPHPDSGSRDAGSRDSGVRDSGSSDVGVPESGTDASTSKCPYPAGPYGSAVTDVLNPALSWAVYAPGATSPSTLKVTDLYDCDGSKGINALVFETAAQWCPVCQYESQSIPGWMSSTAPNAGDFAALGVQWVTLVVQDNDDHPATITTAEQWRNEFGLTSIYVAADPTASFTTHTIPYNVLVNPRTMTVMVDLDNDSYDAAVPGDAATLMEPDPAIAAMAKQNQTDQ